MSDWVDYAEFGPPRKVEGGIKARSQRGDIGRTWWSRRFLEVLESLGMGGRLQRGRRYARAGQVLSLSLSAGIVVAQVQGSREVPYKVRIGVKTFSPAQWSTVESTLAGQALFAAKLLAGEMPAEIEEVFAELDLRLFPDSTRELSMDCSCPDWEVPCKHLAATCYLLAESFDADPFEILAWRGRGREELLDRLRALRGTPARAPRSAEPLAGPASPPLAECLDTFWHRRSTLAVLDNGAEHAQVGEPDAILDQLDPLPLTVAGRPAVDLLRPAYRAMADPPD